MIQEKEERYALQPSVIARHMGTTQSNGYEQLRRYQGGTKYIINLSHYIAGTDTLMIMMPGQPFKATFV